MDLSPGERVIYEGHPSWRATLGLYVAGLVVVAAAAAIGYVASGTGIAVAAGAATFVVVLIAGWAKRISTSYLITNRRLQVRRGILARNVEETRVERIVDVNVRQSLFERVLGIGTVNFDNAGRQEGDDFRFAGISRPRHVTEALNQVHEEGARAGAPPDGSS